MKYRSHGSKFAFDLHLLAQRVGQIDIKTRGLVLPLTVSNGGLVVVVPKCSVVADAVPVASVASSRTVSAFSFYFLVIIVVDRQRAISACKLE